jgi:outer membrane protein OmpA-like peptidoglycan-associated protein
MIDILTNRGRAMLLMALGALTTLGCGASHEPPPPSPPPPPPVVTTTPAVTQPPPPRVTSLPTTEDWIQLPVRIEYPSGGSRLDDQARAVIREGYASMAHRTDIIRIRVEGHADGRGSAVANQQLGLDRAQGVVDFLVGELGMPRELFEVVSYGDTRPLTSETTPVDRVVNRRVEFSLLVRRQAAM